MGSKKNILGLLCLVATTLACEGVPQPEKGPAAITAPLPELPPPEAPPGTRVTADATPAEIKARQEHYLEAWRRADKGAWAGLSPEQREKERAELKRKVLER